MKRFTFIIASVLLAGCLFICTDIRSKALLRREPVKKAFSYGISFTYHPNLLNTFNNLFPIYSYEKEVCRKPFGYGLSLFNKDYHFFSKAYQYEGFLYKTQPLGTHFLNVEGNRIYQSGNTLLLIPHSYIIPAAPSFNAEMPRVLIPGSD